jgi:CheY-like chemotaxis protein
VPLNILLADDSIPAQNMGKKILIDAGYDVLTVGNGLEALRKINEAAPDIAILDIFMPGYTGLEICERLRANVATAALPVILTVGKLEPYRPEDGEHVHSNAVIVKPFAAAELVSAVRSLIGAPPPKVVIPVEAPLPQEGYYVSDEELTSNPLDMDDFASTPEPSMGAAQLEELDEPLFFSGQSSAAEDYGPFAAMESSDPGIIHPDFNNNSNGPGSLVFNPDAKPTPFSATAIDFAPSAIPSTHEDESPFSEFDLASSASGPEPDVAEEPAPWSRVAAVEVAPTIPAEVTATDVPLIGGSAPASVPEQIVSGSAPLNLDPPFLDIPAFDPMLEVREEEPVFNAEPGRGSEEILTEAEPAQVAVDGVVAGQQSAEQANEGEEARRLAFEELFNSTEPIPVENLPATDSDTSFAMLPNMADLSKNHPYHVEQDRELESFTDVSHSDFVAPELDPYLIHDEESAYSAKQDVLEPAHAPLLDDLLETSGGSESEAGQLAATVASPGEMYLPQLGEVSEAVPESAEAQVAFIEDHPFEAETIEAARTAEIERQHDPEPPQPEPAPLEHLEVEPVHLGPLQTEPVQAEQPQADLAIAHVELPLETPIAASTEVSPEVAESASLPVNAEPEAAVPELLVVPESTQREPAPLEVAPLPPETPVNGLSLSPELIVELSEEERVSRAVDRVLDRLKRILVKAIVREMGRHD